MMDLSIQTSTNRFEEIIDETKPEPPWKPWFFCFPFKPPLKQELTAHLGMVYTYKYGDGWGMIVFPPFSIKSW